MRVVGVCCLHYGSEYLSYAMRSIGKFVDKIIIFYSSQPSHNKADVEIPPSESYDNLLKAAKVSGVPYDWVSGVWDRECDHREAMTEYAIKKGYDTAIVLDSDEIWDPSTASQCLIAAASSIKYSNTVPVRHIWKSFNQVCDDPCRPVRILRLKHDRTGCEHFSPKKPIWHFGYCISDPLMQYKWRIHGHRDELRKGWYTEIWRTNEIINVHPTNENFWDVKSLNPKELPSVMRLHPRWRMNFDSGGIKNKKDA